MEIARRIQLPVENSWSLFTQYVEDNRRYFNMYRVRALIWSFFTPLIMSIPAYLFVVTFDRFDFASIIQFLLAILLFVTWTVFPGIFLYALSDQTKASTIWFWTWLGLVPISLIVWMVLFS